MVAVVIVVGDEPFDAGVKITWQEVILQQNAVFEGLVPSFYLALGLRVVWSATNVIHTMIIEPVSQFCQDVAGAIIRQLSRLVTDSQLITPRCL